MEPAQGAAKKRKEGRRLVGLVVSDKMDKTVVVGVSRMVSHPIYEKYVRRQMKYKAHDEKNECKAGDRVEIVETRPLSKTKRWKVQRVLEKAKV